MTARVNCCAQGTIEPVHVTFEGQPPGTSRFVQQYWENYMWFRPMGIIGPGNGFERVGAAPPSSFPDNGTAYLATGAGDSLVFSFLDVSAFDLHSVDLAEFSTLYPTPLSVRFVGYKFGGAVVTSDLVTDGIIDGTGPIADFQTFTFGPDFSDLVRVEIPNYGWSLDNLRLGHHIPEPSTLSILLLGVCCVLRALHCRR